MWKDLSMKEKAALMRVAIKNGIYGLEEIRNKYDEGGIFETLDNYASKAESPLVAASLASSGATLVAPNPVTAGAALVSNLAGAGVDLYQGLRSAYKGDWSGAARNATELGLGLIGLKYLKAAEKASKLDKALRASNATREMVTKTVGRGKGKHLVTMPKERFQSSEYGGMGLGATIGSNVMGFTGGLDAYEPEYPTVNLPEIEVKPNRKAEGGNINSLQDHQRLRYDLGLPAISTEDNPIIYENPEAKSWKDAYKDLSKGFQEAVKDRLQGLNTGLSIEDMYNSRKYDAAIKSKWINFPRSGRVKDNDSPTKYESEIMEEKINKGMYNHPEGISPNMKYAIPYIDEKEIKIPGVGRTSSNALDSIAKYAELANIPLSDAIGLAAQETTLGAIPYYNYKKGDGEYNRILGNSSYFRNYGIIPAENLVRDFRYNIKEDPIDRSVPPLLHAFEYFKSGKYNTKEPDHTSKVKKRGKEVTSTKVVRDWAKKKGYKL